MQAVATDELPLSQLPRKARHCHKFKNIRIPLISVCQLCDNDLEVTFRRHHVTVNDPTGRELIRGHRDPLSSLWLMPLSDTPVTQLPPSTQQHPSPQANSAYEQQAVPKLMEFLHGCLNYPPRSTLLNAISQNYLPSLPGLTALRVRKYLPKSEHTTMGHMHLLRKGLRPTSKGDPFEPPIDPPTEDSTEPPLPPPRQPLDRTRNLGFFCVPFTELKNLICADLPGRFPITSERGHKYVYLMYDFDSNYIQGLPIKSRKTENIIEAFETCVSVLVKAGFTPRVLRLDNEISKTLIEAIETRKLQYQLAAPGDHRLNPAERAIQTFKNHFITGLNGVHPTYPKNCWDLLLPQSFMTLNMMRPSRFNPLISAWTQVHGEFNFDRTPLAPLGCKVIIHDRPRQRGAWEDHGTPGYYIRRAEHHYRCYTSWIPTTHAERVSNTVEFFPENGMPPTSSADRLLAVTEDLIEIITTPHPATPFLDYGTAAHDAVQKLQTIYNIPNQQPPKTSPPQQGQSSPPAMAPSPPDPQQPPRVSRRTPSPPLVETVDDDDSPLPKNLRSNLNNDYWKPKTQFPLNTYVRKSFSSPTGDDQYYSGIITAYDPTTGFYHIKYETATKKNSPTPKSNNIEQHVAAPFPPGPRPTPPPSSTAAP